MLNLAVLEAFGSYEIAYIPQRWQKSCLSPVYQQIGKLEILFYHVSHYGTRGPDHLKRTLQLHQNGDLDGASAVDEIEARKLQRQ
jgi:hypothetical protein